jgi:hypothetical protein
MMATRYNTLLMLILSVLTTPLSGISNLTQNDPYPVYTSADPQEFLTDCLKKQFNGEGCLEKCRSQARLSFSGFRQAATCGVPFQPVGGCSGGFVTDYVELGNLLGPWNVVGLLLDPQVRTNILGPCGLNIEDLVVSCSGTLFDPALSDTYKRFGFLNVPIKYRKYGVRVEAEVRLACDLTVKIQTGIADIRQTPQLNDLTCSATGLSCPVHICPETVTPIECATGDVVGGGTSCITNECCINNFNCDCKSFVIENIMKRIDTVACALGLDIREFHKTAFEDTRVILNWRHVYPVNYCEPGWPFFLFMPYLSLETSFPTGKKKNPCQLFGLPFGNNGSFAVGGTAGFTVDFVETIEIGAEVGITHFSSRTETNYPVPTFDVQAGMFPRKATVHISPGNNWNFILTMNAYHFLERLSVWIQYVNVSHSEDCFNIRSLCPEFGLNACTRKLYEESKWESQFIDAGFNYDISTDIALGLFFQIPISQRNAYRPVTILGSLVLHYG